MFCVVSYRVGYFFVSYWVLTIDPNEQLSDAAMIPVTKCRRK